MFLLYLVRYIFFLNLKRFTVASHSPIHTMTAVPTIQRNNQHVRRSSRSESCSGTPRHLARRSPGIEPATFLFPVSRQPILPPELLPPRGGLMLVTPTVCMDPPHVGRWLVFHRSSPSVRQGDSVLPGHPVLQFSDNL